MRPQARVRQVASAVRSKVSEWSDKVSPYASKSDISVLVLLIAIWGALFFACQWESPLDAVMSVPTVLHSATVSLAGWPNLLSLFQWMPAFPRSSSAASYLTATTTADQEAIIDDLFSNPKFIARVREMAVEQLRPVKEDLLALSDKKIEEIRYLVARMTSENQKQTESSIEMKLKSLQFVLEEELSQSLENLALTVKSDHSKNFEKLSSEIRSLQEHNSQLGESADDSPAILDQEVKRLQKRLDAVAAVQDEFERRATLCCKTTAQLEAEAREVVANWMKSAVGGGGNASEGDNPMASLNEYLHSRFVSREEMDHQVEAWVTTLNDEIYARTSLLADEFAVKSSRSAVDDMLRNSTVISLLQNTVASSMHLESSSQSSPGSQEILSAVQEALKIYDADRTGMFDFALESAGGTVASTRCTETYDLSRAVYTVFGLPIWWEHNRPHTILQPGSHPGQCWAFKGSHGAVVVRLSSSIIPTAVSLEHIPKMMSPDGTISSALKTFSVLALRRLDDENPVSMGNFTYLDNSSPVQTFYLEKVTEPFKLVELKVLSNHGNVFYTCLYRFRVHGNLPDKS